jgi:hypothetical protein
MYHWIQLSTSQNEELEKQGLVTKNSGYKYKNCDGIDKIFQEKTDREIRFSKHFSV